jgi:tetratricopeptide (TPR) repeat protein
MSWLGSVGPAVVSSAVVAAGVSALSSVITNRDNLYAAYRLDQKKKLRELIGAYSGRMLEAASDWDRRMHQLYAPNGTDHMAVPEEKLHAHDQYLYLSVVFRFLSLLGIARKFESEAFYIDSRIARPKDLDFLRYAKSFLWVMTDSKLTPDDGMPGVDHFRSDEFRPLLDVCYRRDEALLPKNEPKKGELVFDWSRFRALLDNSGKNQSSDESQELDPDTQEEINQVLYYFAGIRPNEYDGDLKKRRRWERVICLHLLTICFIGTFGYSWQKRSKYLDEKRDEAISALKNEALAAQGNETADFVSVLNAFADNLHMTGMESNRWVNKIRRKQISKLERDLRAAISSLPQITAHALPMQEKALQVADRKLGRNHPHTALRLGNLAFTFHALERHADALPLEQRALRITKRNLGAIHLHTALRLDNLARAYHDLGQPAEALPLEKQALRITEEKLGPDHLHTALRLGNLARTYDALGRHAEALPLEERARQITEERLGADHMHAALRLGNALLITEN